MKKYAIILVILLACILRLYKLGSVPPSLYWDEASLGYNAYSILVSAHDEHGKLLPLTNFAAFGDYKPPGYIYATVPSIAAFGLDEFAVRLPSAIFGILTVILSYLLTKKLFNNEGIAVLAALFLAISPWHLQFSRAAFEANMGLFLSTLGIYLFIKFAQDSPWFLIPSAISFIAAMYTFTGQRLFVPPMVLLLAVFFLKEVKKNIRFVLVSTILALILFYPLLIFILRTQEGKLRFNEVTIFKDLAPINQSIQARQRDSYKWWANIIHNRRVFFAQDYLKHYSDAFSPAFLFSRGDVNPRLSIQTVGELYYYDLIFILAGIYFLFAYKQKFRFLIIGWILISPLGPATARETPHALRMIHILPTFQILSAYGIYCLYQKYKTYSKAFIPISCAVVAISFIYYFHMYYIHWPLDYSQEWQYGYKQAVTIAGKYYDQVDHIVVTEAYGRPYIYFLFYTKQDPRIYLKTAEIIRDQFLFFSVKSYDKYIFTNSPSNVMLNGKNLYIVSSGQLPANIRKVDEVRNPAGKTIFEIGLNKI